MMWQNYYFHWMMPFGGFLPYALGGVLLAAVIIWSIAWKGVALWKAARAGDNVWFVALLLINTAGILEILYIYVFSKRSKPVV